MATFTFTVHRRPHQREGTLTESFDDSRSETKAIPGNVEQRACELLSQHPHFRGRAGDFEYEYREDVLVVRGRVPTFCLKQVLQTVLRDVNGVTQSTIVWTSSPVMASAVSVGRRVRWHTEILAIADAADLAFACTADCSRVGDRELDELQIGLGIAI